MKKYFLLLHVILCFTTGVSQIVDSTFTPNIEGLPEIRLIKPLSNEKLILSGEITSIQDKKNNGVALLNSDGTIDDSFSLEIISSGSVFDVIYDSNIDKYYVAGAFDDFNDLIRLNHDGTLDDSFNVEVDLSRVSQIGLQSNDKIIAISRTSGMGMIRLTPDGSIDSTFNNSIGFNSVSSNYGDLKILEDDKILYGGYFETFNNDSLSYLLKFNADGLIDDSFSFSNALTSSSFFTYINSVLPLENGDIIIAGNFNSIYGNPAKGIAKIKANGTLDPSFILPGASGNTFQRSVRAAFDHKNNILVTGINSDVDGYTLLRLDQNGAVDTSFKTGNAEYVNFTGYLVEPLISVSTTGEIYFSAFFTEYDNNFRQGLVKLNNDGELIIEFDADIAGKASLRATKFMSDGSVLVGGKFTAINNQPMNSFAKLFSDGSVDLEFMENLGDGPDLTVYSIEVDNSNNIILGGGFRYFNNEYTGSLVRLLNDGTLDETFTPNVYSPFIGPGVNEILVTDSNHIFVGGLITSVSGIPINGFAKINNDGTLDDSFDLGLPSEADIKNIELRPDGSLIYAGNIGFENDIILGKTDQSGNSDPSFNVDYDFSGLRLLCAAVITETGEILVSTTEPNNYQLIQFESNGTLKDDVSIGTTGSSGISEILPLDSENIIVGGQFSSINSVSSPGLAKINLSGGVDSNFNFGLVEIGNFSGPSVSNIIDLGDSTYLISGNFSKVDGVDVTSIAIIDTKFPISPDEIQGNFSYANGITINWNDNTSLESGYELYKKSSDNGPFELLAMLGVNETSYVDPNVSLASNYGYRVRAVNGDLSSSYSEELEISIEDLSIPKEFTFDFDYSKGLSLSWVNNSVPDESIIELYKSEPGSEFDLVLELDANQNTYEDSLVSLSTDYLYFLKVVAGIFEKKSDVLSYTTPGSAMLPTPELQFTQTGTDYILDWEYGISQILGFEIYRSKGNLSEFELITKVDDNIYYTLDTQPGIEYHYKIKAYNAFESSEFSNEVGFVITDLESIELENLNLSPNPVASVLRIESDSIHGIYEILNTQGVVIKGGNIKQELNVSQLNNGLYVMNIYSGGKVFTKRFVVLH